MCRKNHLLSKVEQLKVFTFLITVLVSSIGFSAIPHNTIERVAAPDWYSSLPQGDFTLQAVFQTNQSLTSSSDDSPSRTANSVENIFVTLTQKGENLFFSSGNALFTEVDKNGSGCVFIEKERGRSTADWEAKERATLSACLLSGMRVSFGGYTLDFDGHNAKTGHWVIQQQNNTPVNGAAIVNWTKSNK
jgi:hypothetical protein